MPTPSGGPTSSPCVSIGICGQGPSDHPDLAEWLLRQGIESMSLNPDTVVDTWLQLSKLPRVP
jgi:pyruvate, water dikinase